MKRFYQLLLIVTALVSGNMFGMEREIDINILRKNMNTVRRAYFFGFINKDEPDCINKAGQKVNRLNAIIQKVDRNPLSCTDDELDFFMVGVQIFDTTQLYGHDAYESLVFGTLDAIIKAKNAQGLTFQMQPWEDIILQKGAVLQGISKQYVHVLHRKEQKQDELQELQKQADNVAFRIFIELSLIVESRDGQCEKLDTLLQNELGADAPFGNYLDYINIKIREDIQDPIMAGDKEAQLNNLWNIKFEGLLHQYKPYIDFLNQQNQNKEQQDLENQQRIEEEQQLEQTHQVKQGQQQKSTLADLLNQYKPQSVNLPTQQQQNQPDIEGGQPRPDAPKGVAVLCAAIAPKLAIMAVVVGVGYWGYTKYIAYKAAQADEQKEQEEQEEAENKHTAHNKLSVPKQQQITKQCVLKK